MRKQHLKEVFYLKECPQNNCFSLNIAHTHFPFGGENSANSQRVGYLTKSIINERPLLLLLPQLGLTWILEEPDMS